MEVQANKSGRISAASGALGAKLCPPSALVERKGVLPLLYPFGTLLWLGWGMQCNESPAVYTQLLPEHPSGKSMRNRICHAGPACSGSSLWSHAAEVTILCCSHKHFLQQTVPPGGPPAIGHVQSSAFLSLRRRQLRFVSVSFIIQQLKCSGLVATRECINDL